jgi:UDP-N-acetylglucosamine--N-acetylmuramyl-(pentapeptide) pyrophosphoryl-undecaprenol N-acetylglucosamine transferase
MELELLEREEIPFETIPAAGLHGVGLKALPGNLWQIFKGMFAARKILERFIPDVVLYTGGYLAVPVALASRIPRWGKPAPKNLVYVPDIQPGLALKMLGYLADRIALTTEESMEYFPFKQKLVVTGYPIRDSLRSWTRESAIEVLNLEQDLPTLLVFGGSKGSRSINQTLFRILTNLLGHMQVVHITGHLDWPEVDRVINKLDAKLVKRYHAFPYLHEEMGAALQAADLVVSRAGASVLGEYPLFGVPAILVPYPHAWRYQEVNARYLVDQGAAVMLKDEELPSTLLPTIQMILADLLKRDEMRRAMNGLARPAAADSIANLVYSLAT